MQVRRIDDFNTGDMIHLANLTISNKDSGLSKNPKEGITRQIERTITATSAASHLKSGMHWTTKLKPYG